MLTFTFSPLSARAAAIFSMPWSSLATPPFSARALSTAFTAICTSVPSWMSSGSATLPPFSATFSVLRLPSRSV